MSQDHRIANYDETGYKYDKYWSDQVVGRAYEDLAERLAISRMLPKSGYWFLDLGGGYARLSDLYINRFENIIIGDYSIENLKRAKQIIGTKNTLNSNIYYIALNAYHLPFKNDCFDCELTVRMMTHIENPVEVFSEVFRTLAPNNHFILEFSNKRHLLEVFRGLLGISTFNPFSLDPAYRGDLFINFHPEDIKRKLRQVGFGSQKALSVSNLRSQLLKKTIPNKILIAAESFLQYGFSFARLGPSIFIKAEKPASRLPITIPSSIQELLCCPACSVHPLIFKQNEITCPNCSESYIIDDGIIDLRIT